MKAEIRWCVHWPGEAGDGRLSTRKRGRDMERVFPAALQRKAPTREAAEPRYLRFYAAFRQCHVLSHGVEKWGQLRHRGGRSE